MTASQTQPERDLHFHPVVNPTPKRLSASDIARFNAEGHLSPFHIYDAADADRNRAYFDGLLEQVRAANDGRDEYSINGYHTTCAGLWDIVMNPRILDIVEDLLGPNFVAWGTHYFCKLPHDDRTVPWHQDASYWPLTPSKTVTAWLAIDDADAENAAMQVIPTSHLKGHLAWEQTRQPRVVLGQEVLDVAQYGTPEYVTLKAGEVSFHSDLLLHGSEANTSDRRRCGLTIRYASTDVRVLQEGWKSRSILCRGVDEANYWNNSPRPQEEDAQPRDWQKR
jgi:hypothetical protein